MAKKNRPSSNSITDCACVIHGTGYDWVYVEKLYNMLTRHLPGGIRFHVYTEQDRPVPPHMIKHALKEWPGVGGPKREWWYKMQLFNSEHHSGNLLYFDLDCVIINDLSWIPALSTECFWTIRDFRYLQRKTYSGMNSSVMWWNVSKFADVWHEFDQLDINRTVVKYPGDQDYLGVAIDPNQRRYFDQQHLQSWRWQVSDGGYNFATRKPHAPGSGSNAYIGGDTSILVFHGKPKPHECTNDPVIANNWC
jgi:hypothetical protein